MTDIVHELNILLSESGFKSNCIITCDDVDLAVRKLKLNKNDGNRGLSSNHIKHGNNKLNIHISFLLTGILCHGCVPDDLLVSTRDNQNRDRSQTLKCLDLAVMTDSLSRTHFSDNRILLVKRPLVFGLVEFQSVMYSLLYLI